MERNAAGEARVLPIILRPVHFQDAPFGRLQVLPTGAVPITSKKWESQDEAFYHVAQGIRNIVEAFAQKSSALPVGIVPSSSPHAPFLVEEVPPDFVERPREFEQLIHCLFDQNRGGTDRNHDSIARCWRVRKNDTSASPLPR